VSVRACPGTGRACAGASLLECLVGLALGLAVVAAVASQYLAAGHSARLQAAQAQMVEDAQIALELLRGELMMAGYARPVRLDLAADGLPRWQTALGAQAPLFACDQGFVAPASAEPLVCAGAGASAALELRYQADRFNTVPLSGSDRPSDCLGAGLGAHEGVYLTYNRWYVASSQGRTELRCASRLGHPGQPLVDNVEALALWFSEAGSAPGAGPARFVKASQVSSFSRVRSVRVCLLMRSADAVLADGISGEFRDCEGRAQVSGDRRLRRAFSATVSLRNRGGG
jgi:type IV pilus assembly protein PilW